MAKDIVTNTFSGGMNKDIDYSILPNNTYVHAENIKLIANEDSNGFILENAEGNTELINITDIDGVTVSYNIVGSCVIDKYLVLFLTTSSSITPSTDTSIIARITIIDGKVQSKDRIYIDSAAKGRLKLSSVYPLKTVGSYESEDNIKVYFSDGYNEDRFVNIMDSSVADQNINKFSLIPDFPDTSATGDVRPIFEELTDGRIKASKVQYTYQYYTLNGAATKFAPVSPPIAIPASTNVNDESLYMGGEVDEYTQVGCKLKINTPATKPFNRIRLVALDYNTVNSTPSVRVFGEYELDTSDTSTALYFTDIGQTIDEILYEDFLTYGNVLYKSKDLEIKNNILFKANIQEETFDVDFDARAYRHNASAVARIYSSNLTDYLDIDDGNESYNDYTDVPETHDCINLYNSPDYEGNTSYQYIYRDNGSDIGATGKNITIEQDFAYATSGDTMLNIDNLGLSSLSTIKADTGDNPADPYNLAYNNSFQRHEVYRLGVIFFNEKLQNSPVKWICDYKMPHHYQGGVLGAGNSRFSYLSTNDTKSNMLGLKVTLHNMPSEAFGWQLVMVKREFNDRSVVANGIMQTPTNGGSGTTGYIPADPRSSTTYNTLTTEAEIDDGNNYLNKIMVFISPEINFLRNLEFKSGDFLQYNGSFNYDKNTNSNGMEYGNGTFHKLNAFGGIADPYNPSYGVLQSELSEVKVIEQPGSPENSDATTKYQVSIDAYNYIPIVGNNVGAGTSFTGLHGTHAICYSDTPINPTGSITEVPYVSYRRNVFTSQYGGLDYYSRQRNEYIGISQVYYDEASYETYEGDITIDYFHYLKQSINLENDNNSYVGKLLFPVESTVVLGFRSDRELSKFNETSTLVREIAGIHESSSELYYNQENDLYQYNTVYSFNGSGQLYLDTVLDTSDEDCFPMRVIHSDTKISDSLHDAFTIFRSNNYLNVDGKYGPINNLVNFKNTLYYWQDRAFGVLSVNTRSLLQDNNPGILALGIGGILDRYDYLSTSVGNTNDFGIITSNEYIYWVDNNKNEIFKFGGSKESLSKTTGIQSWINSKGKIGNVIGEYDNKYNDVIFTIRFNSTISGEAESGNFPTTYTSTDLSLTNGTAYNCIVNGRYDTDYPIVANKNIITYALATTNYTLSKNPYGGINSNYSVVPLERTDNAYTLSFNEQLNKFVSFNSFEPIAYVNMNGYLLSSNNGYKLWLHNSDTANRSQYYGTYYDSIITTVFNKNYPYTKVFDTIKWISESKNSSGVNIFKDTFDEVEFYNDWQHTGNRDLYYQHDSAPTTRPTPISRRERTWSMQVPRDIVDTTVESNSDITDSDNWDETNGRLSRIRDKYMVGKFTYENSSNNYTFSVPFISSVYRISYR